MVVFFSSYFVLTTPGHFSDQKAKCVAYLKGRDSRTRCRSNWKVSEDDVSHISALQDDYENESEPEKRAGILRCIAARCLCGTHRRSEEAAVYQWNNEIQSQASNSHLDRFESSQPQRRRESSIDFKRYGCQEVEEASGDEKDLTSLLGRGVELRRRICLST